MARTKKSNADQHIAQETPRYDVTEEKRDVGVMHEVYKVKYLARKGDIFAVSDLNKSEIVEFMRLKAFAELADDDEITALCNELISFYALLKISHKREGRKELLKVGEKARSNIIQNIISRRRTLEEQY
jgi:hypothetical protein